MWIKTVRGQYINLDHVAEFSFQAYDKEKNQTNMTVEYAGGEREQVTIYSTTVGDLEELIFQQTFMPSPPGYTLLSYYPGEETNGEEIITRWPVLAWVFDLEFAFHRVVTAWTSGDNDEFREEDAILCPSGHVVRPGDSWWDNEVLWVEEMRQKKKKAA